MTETILEIAKEVFSQYIDVDQLRPDTPFDSLDIDSLLLVELAVMLNHRLHFIVTEFEIKFANNIQALAVLYDASSSSTLAERHGDEPAASGSHTRR